METENDELVVEDLDKAELFNKHFLSHSNIDTSGASLPAFLGNQGDNLNLESLTIKDDDVLQILRGLNTSKATGPDGISAKMLREAAPAITPSLTRLINMSLRLCRVPTLWKRANVVALHKKLDRSSVSNYRPISLLSCTSKVMETCIFKYVFNYIRDNSLLTKLQSGFMPNDSTVNQLVHIYHMFTEALDKKKDVRVVFCDITKAFDRVWHDSLIFKLKKLGIKNDLLHWFKDYLSHRQQRVVINGEHSSWGHIKAGVPQGSVLGPLLFLVYINDITENINTNIRLFADDTTLFVTVDDPVESNNILNADLSTLREWANKWLVLFSPPKTKALTLSLKPIDPGYQPLEMGNSVLSDVNEHKHLGITLTKNVSWSSHIANTCASASKRLDIMTGLKHRLDRRSLEIMYMSFVRPLLEYADVLWDGCFERDAESLELVQRRAARIVSGAIRGTPTVNVYKELAWEPLSKRRERHKLIMFFKIVNGMTPASLSDLLLPRVDERTRYNLRNTADFTNFACRTETFKRSFFPSTTILWNSLPVCIRNSTSIREFKRHLNQDIPQLKPWFHTGGRRLSLIHAQLRMGCSNLNAHLFSLHVADDPACFCGARLEDTTHFMMICPLFVRERAERDTSINELHLDTDIDIDILLYGSNDLNTEHNVTIFSTVQHYIEVTGRFN
jgi:hypothetical protein